MKSLFLKLFFTLLATLGLLVFALPWNYFGFHIPYSGPDYKLGLDLQGGIELDYTVDLSQVETEQDYNMQRKNAILEGLKSIVDKRIESLNINDSVITSASYGNEEHIIVQIPLKGNDSLGNSQNIERAKAAIGKVVKIEFKQLRDAITTEDIQTRKIAIDASIKDLLASKNFYIDSQKVVNSFENSTSGESKNLETLFTLDQESKNTISSLSDGKISDVMQVKNTDKKEGYLLVKKSKQQYQYIFFLSEPSIWKPASDKKGRVLDDTYFTKASVQYNQAFQPLVELTFNSDGAEIFGELTKKLVGQQMAIFVGGEMLTAPTINEPILNGRAVITGNYTPDSANKLAQDINTGVVPAPIYLTSERTIDARLGQDSLEKIIFAGVVSFMVIFIFLIMVYRVSGFIGAVALLAYIIITLTIIKQFGIVLTLASIAGLVLSVGMAIDANILIYERMKDELRKKGSLIHAQKIGFEQSFSAIWDSNLTGFIVALILFIFGVNMIKGFGFILALGIVVSMFSVFFISRIFIKMLAHTKISPKNFIGKL